MANLRRSATLEPPRKSIELEDPGAHELEASENEEDIFSDAQEGHGSYSDTNSPIPITRVERVDDHDSYGEVPGTAAYKMRMQDAVPDELEIIPDGEETKHASGVTSQNSSQTGASISIPKTVVQKVDPVSPRHGEASGTNARSAHKADAVPDVIVQVDDPEITSPPEAQSKNTSPHIPVPEIGTAKSALVSGKKEGIGQETGSNIGGMVGPLESEEKSEGHNLPTYSLSRSTFSRAIHSGSLSEEVFPIAIDGGFGPMRDKMAETRSIDSDTNLHTFGESEAEDDQGEDFDDFEAGAEDAEFGDFDDGFQQPSFFTDRSSDSSRVNGTKQVVSAPASPFPLLDFSQLDSADNLVSASALYLDTIFPTTQVPQSPHLSPPPENYPIFLTDRSLSLWSQLVAPPPLQPPNWVRSRIRRLFLVSLGVPVDLDEILPASKQKKLILPSTNLHSDSRSPSKGGYDGSRVKLKQDNASSASIDQPPSQKANRRRKGPPPAPELDLGRTKMLCMTTEAALSNFLDHELRAHIRDLEELTARASEVLEYWLKRKDNALGDKEAFEGVIENLVKHARRVRK